MCTGQYSIIFYPGVCRGANRTGTNLKDAGGYGRELTRPLGAIDTTVGAAADQRICFCHRAGMPLYGGKPGSDPAVAVARGLPKTSIKFQNTAEKSGVFSVDGGLKILYTNNRKYFRQNQLQEGITNGVVSKLQ